ncbi:hypothetical protein MHY1_02672 [Methylovirgula sp. HY1]|nr:hypothetical protein MHY1_02672 [Methylovirgula sp. HY1]
MSLASGALACRLPALRAGLRNHRVFFLINWIVKKKLTS